MFPWNSLMVLALGIAALLFTLFMAAWYSPLLFGNNFVL